MRWDVFDVKGNFFILIADDDENDRTLLQLAIQRSNIPVNTSEVYDGEEVINYLRGEGQYSDRVQYPFPDLVIIDLKMPRMNGLEVLDWIRKNPTCHFLPAIMLSGSGLEADILEAHRRGVKAYFIKPNAPDELQNLVRLVAEHWATAEQPKLPTNCP